MIRNRVLRAVCVAALFVLLAGGMVHDAGAQRSLSHVRSRQREVQAELREVKEDQSEASTALARARNEAQAARDRRDAAKRRLDEVRAELREVKADLKQTEQELGVHRKAMSQRLLAMYEVGEPSYLEVILNATSFEDFASRAEFARLIAQQDEQMLRTLVETEERLREQRATLEAKQAEAVALKKEADRQAAVAARREAEAERLVEKYKTDRRSLEAEFAALEQAEREIEAYIRAHAASGRGYTGTCAGNLLRPCSGYISSGFGYRTHPVWGGRRFHNGVDIATASGTTIKAADDGKVIYAGWKGAYGRTVVIDHGSGWSTMYGHCSRIYVSRGQVVSRGQAIAAVGNTGVSTGPHLHWTVYRNGKAINPLR
ncbi:MAG: peptidoglycan DD-metalloendopeptidase family protein [Armatimonadota bacterium]|nr:peptidoglycan DD-metalloendopeptidase family protein [Armatimonadota bacterium]